MCRIVTDVFVEGGIGIGELGKSLSIRCRYVRKIRECSFQVSGDGFLLHISNKPLLLRRGCLHLVLELILLQETNSEIIECLLDCREVYPIPVCQLVFP